MRVAHRDSPRYALVIASDEMTLNDISLITFYHEWKRPFDIFVKGPLPTLPEIMTLDERYLGIPISVMINDYSHIIESKNFPDNYLVKVSSENTGVFLGLSGNPSENRLLLEVATRFTDVHITICQKGFSALIQRYKVYHMCNRGFTFDPKIKTEMTLLGLKLVTPILPSLMKELPSYSSDTVIDFVNAKIREYNQHLAEVIVRVISGEWRVI